MFAREIFVFYFIRYLDKHKQQNNCFLLFKYINLIIVDKVKYDTTIYNPPQRIEFSRHEFST